MIAWCGSRADGLGWLCDRCRSYDNVEIAESICIESIDGICVFKPRRLILSVENRLDYPLAEIQHLQRNWPEIPWALAVGSWFDGSRRTGIGATSHLSLPWYRWWDGWRQWLSGSHAAMLNPWPKIMLSPAIASNIAFTEAAGLVLCNCRQTAEGWRAGLEGDPGASQTQWVRIESRTRWQTSSDYRALLSQASMTDPDWILWDDSYLDTFAGTDCSASVCSLFAELRERFPTALIVAATCMPRWSDWQQWMMAGANEIIAKPTQGILLREVLQESLRSGDFSR